jgi:hypothetical protein
MDPGVAKLELGPASRNVGKLEQALAADDLASAEKAILDLPPDDTGRVMARGALSRAHRQAVRQGKDTLGIEALQMRASIQHGRPQGLVPESTVLPADGQVFVVPSSHAKQYAELAALPPGANPAMPAGTASPAFHARAIAEVPVTAHAPATVQVNGVEYTLLQRMAANSATRVMYVIHPCREEGQEESSATVECHGRTSARAMEEAGRKLLLSQACKDPAQARASGITDCQ